MIYLSLEENYRDQPVAAVSRIKLALRKFDSERVFPEWERPDYSQLCEYLLAEIDDILESYYDRSRFPEDYEVDY